MSWAELTQEGGHSAGHPERRTRRARASQALVPPPLVRRGGLLSLPLLTRHSRAPLPGSHCYSARPVQPCTPLWPGPTRARTWRARLPRASRSCSSCPTGDPLASFHLPALMHRLGYQLADRGALAHRGAAVACFCFSSSARRRLLSSSLLRRHVRPAAARSRRADRAALPRCPRRRLLPDAERWLHGPARSPRGAHEPVRPPLSLP